MPIISSDILKIINEKESCNTRCVVMRWISSEVLIKTVKDADN